MWLNFANFSHPAHRNRTEKSHPLHSHQLHHWLGFVDAATKRWCNTAGLLTNSPDLTLDGRLIALLQLYLFTSTKQNAFTNKPPPLSIKKTLARLITLNLAWIRRWRPFRELVTFCGGHTHLLLNANFAEAELEASNRDTVLWYCSTRRPARRTSTSLSRRRVFTPRRSERRQADAI